jgi:hypothetical protein
VPLATVVRIAELKKTAKGTYALVEQLASPVATRGNQLGWIATSNMRRFERPTRPSSPSTQMAAVLAAARARATRSMGGCYHYVKDAIIVAQGYGDILDINNDPRFSGCLAYATQFKAAIDKYSPAAFGLEQLSGEVASAPPGALVISAGTAKNGIDPRYGDIAVVDGVKDGFTHCYNDGRVRFSTAAKEWKSGGKLENTLLAIYKPIARP